MIDLHAHSLFSDGTYTPEELVEAAVKAKLAAVALTDHDTVAGIPRFLEAAAAVNLRAVPGVELSTSHQPGELHMLGYFIDHADRLLNEQLAWVRRGRRARNEEIMSKLHKLGLHIGWDEVQSYAGDEVVGRPHFAQAMVARGYATSSRDAFDRFLARGKSAYAQRRTLSPHEAIEMIRSAGGVPVLAHPFTLQMKPGPLRLFLGELRDLGLEGVEIYYSDHDSARQREYLKFAKEFDLVASGGSDFHGAVSPKIKLGRGFGSLRVPDEVVDQLYARKP